MNIHGNRKKSVVEAVSEIGWPTLFSALTTFAALLSFLVVPVRPLRFVGITTSFSVLMSFIITITLMPSALSFGKNKKPKEDISEHGGGKLDLFLGRFGDFVLRHGNAILAIFIVVMAFFAFYMTKIETSFDIERTMGTKVDYVRNILKIGKTELGSIYSYDLLIDLPQNGMAKQPNSLMLLDSIENYSAKFPLTKRQTSILNIVKDMNRTLHGGKQEFYKIPDSEREIAQLLLLYENAGGSEAEKWMDYEYKRLRLRVEIDNYNSQEAENELNDITAYSQKLFPDAVVTTVGSIPQFTIMMQYVVRGQIKSFLFALCIIGVLLILVLGNVRVGLIGLIPNIAPAIIVGGLMGLFKIPLDMMTATIMPMILGLAVDDTIHFINYGHLEFDRQKNYQRSINKAFRIVGTPLLLTSLVISANFAVYMVSDALSVLHLGILAVAGMFSALLSDLFITPVLFKKFNIFGKEK